MQNYSDEIEGLFILKSARDRFALPGKLFDADGKLHASDNRTIQEIVVLINNARQQRGSSAIPLKAGQFNVLMLLHDINQYITAQYRLETNTEFLERSTLWIIDRLGRDAFNRVTTGYVELFPPQLVVQGQCSVEEYLDEEKGRKPNRLLKLEELLVLMIDNENPAFSICRELFNDASLESATPYRKLMKSFEDHIDTQVPFADTRQSLIQFLRSPYRKHPHSLKDQLVYIKDTWEKYLSASLLKRILLALDVLKEEEKLGFHGPGPLRVLEFGRHLADYDYQYDEPERFSSETDWMSEVVLLAKNAMVWLHQLSKKYGRSITRLDQIPDEELDLLARWGFTGLWLIGLWKRSSASQRIKQMCGNPEAVASAYSLYDYIIDDRLGGNDALHNLQTRAWQRGIRLASDMVPNHMGIYSRWVIEHPDWFMQTDLPPYPRYSYTGHDLSEDDRVSLHIEDGYWNRSDAAVVFKRTDKWTGDTRYIYHGNDGTSMPWNDTAQLDFLKAEVRESLIRTILHVARMFPIIRFDAAMTLAKRHFQRLWYPEPGTGGDIPSRADHSLSREEFNRLFPVEFWREVVDRVNSEAPDTLLLAEAFWLMEGYFVRTLGMHRVYNSAFMNMLKMEENAKYRSVLKNVLEFNPEILRRFVNFMNNPDEDTAVAQFGTGDKYFGVATMMVTIPGLPLFGHGQVEGLKEKYGMEYARDYWNEDTDWEFVKRHETDIFPLMKLRYLFSGITDFVLYDFFLDNGQVDENVFTYSNAARGDKALIVYNNQFASTAGWVRMSVAMSVPAVTGNSRALIRKDLAAGLGLSGDEKCFAVFRDHKSGLEYIRPSNELSSKGLHVQLSGYQCHVFLNFREIHDDHEGNYRKLFSYLDGKGTPSIRESVMEIKLMPVHLPFKSLINPEKMEFLDTVRKARFSQDVLQTGLDQDIQPVLIAWLQAACSYLRAENDTGAITRDIIKELMTVFHVNDAIKSVMPAGLGNLVPAKEPGDTGITVPDSGLNRHWHILYTWTIIRQTGRVDSSETYESATSAIWNNWLLEKIIRECLRACGQDHNMAWHDARLITILINHQSWGTEYLKNCNTRYLCRLLDDPAVQKYLHYNRYDNILWFNKEMLSELLYWLFITFVIRVIAGQKYPGIDAGAAETIKLLHQELQMIMHHAEQSEFRVEAFKDLLET